MCKETMHAAVGLASSVSYDINKLCSTVHNFSPQNVALFSMFEGKMETTKKV